MFTVAIKDVLLLSKPITYEYPLHVNQTYTLIEFVNTLYELYNNGHSETIGYTIYYHNETFYTTRIAVDTIGNDYFGQLSRRFKETHQKSEHIQQFEAVLGKMIQEYANSLSNNATDDNKNPIALTKRKKGNNIRYIIGGVVLCFSVIVFIVIKNDGLALVGINSSPGSIDTSVKQHANTSYAINSGHGALDTLLQQKQYDKALVQFPDKVDVIEWVMYQQGDVKALEALITTYDNNSYRFDLAFLQKEYQKVISFSAIDLTDSRQEMLGIAYLEAGQFMEAAYINSVLNHSELTERLKPKALTYIKQYLALKDFDNAKRMNVWTQAGYDELIVKAQKINVLMTHYDTLEKTEGISEALKRQAIKDKQLWQAKWQQIIQP